jgi:ferredoxin
MQARVDATRCSGYGNCADTCPSVFELDEWGYAAVTGDGTVPEADAELARAAAAGCPEQAITIE